MAPSRRGPGPAGLAIRGLEGRPSGLPVESDAQDASTPGRAASGEAGRLQASFASAVDPSRIFSTERTSFSIANGLRM